MLKSVEKYITEYNMIAPGDDVTIGVSGGADSVCLLLNLIEFSEKTPITIKVVHINHKIRQEASVDANFVNELCKVYDLPFFLFEEDVEKMAKENGISTEEAGRVIRYRRFHEVSDGGKIAVAHNSNDIAETVLFNIFRGTGLEGLASLEPVNGDIIRPLLGTTREDIEKYLVENKQDFVTDKTNLTDAYARNKVRNRILPFAEENIVSGATAHVAALSEKMRLVRHYIENQTKIAFDQTVTASEEMKISLEAFSKLEKLMQQEVVLLALEKLTAGRKDIGEKHVEAILSLIDGEGEKKVDLPYNLEAIKQYETLTIREKNQNLSKNLFSIKVEGEGDYLVKDIGELSVKIFSKKDNLSINRNTYTKWFDYDKINSCLVVRNRLSGDYLTINSQLSTKSLKDYLMDEKIPKEQRDTIPVVADGNHILWVIGHRISEAYKVTEDTKTIIELEYKCLGGQNGREASY